MEGVNHWKIRWYWSSYAQLRIACTAFLFCITRQIKIERNVGNRSLWRSKISVILSGHITMIWLCKIVVIRWHLGILRRNVLHRLRINNISFVPKLSRTVNHRGRVMIMIQIKTSTLISLRTSYLMRARTNWFSWRMRWRELVKITYQTISKLPIHVQSLWVILGITFLLVY